MMISSIKAKNIYSNQQNIDRKLKDLLFAISHRPSRWPSKHVREEREVKVKVKGRCVKLNAVQSWKWDKFLKLYQHLKPALKSILFESFIPFRLCSLLRRLKKSCREKSRDTEARPSSCRRGRASRGNSSNFLSARTTKWSPLSTARKNFQIYFMTLKIVFIK